MDSWVLGLSAWIIQDGNYPDFERGQLAEFAVEFNLRDFELTSPAAPSATLIEDSDYRSTGEVIFAQAEGWIIDCGISVYDEGLPSGIEQGDWVTGTAFLGVDPFMYFERLHRVPDIPPIIYTWQIDRMGRPTAPFVEVRPRHFERDRSLWGYEDVNGTDAWKDDGGHAAYLLFCTRMDDSPKHRSGTAVYP